MLTVTDNHRTLLLLRGLLLIAKHHKKMSPVQMVQVLGACLEGSYGNGNVRVITSTTGVPHDHTTVTLQHTNNLKSV